MQQVLILREAETELPCLPWTFNKQVYSTRRSNNEEAGEGKGIQDQRELTKKDLLKREQQTSEKKQRPGDGPRSDGAAEGMRPPRDARRISSHLCSKGRGRAFLAGQRRRQNADREQRNRIKRRGFFGFSFSNKSNSTSRL